jgi:gas vesicle protein
MAYEYDRMEREDGSGSFLMGLLAGTVLGAGLGMLFAPKTGSELRNQLTEQAGKLRSTATDGYQQATEKVTQIVDRGREAYDRARSSAASGMSGADDNSESSRPGTSSTSGGIGQPGQSGSMSGAGGGYSGSRG